jgi:hypothetical protein
MGFWQNFPAKKTMSLKTLPTSPLEEMKNKYTSKLA